MSRAAAGLVALALLAAVPAAGQAPGHFYDVDKEVRLDVTVREIAFEPRYKGAAPFLVLRVEDPKTAKTYNVEVSPSWFFDQDIHGGERVRIIGSLAEVPDGAPTVIARELRLRGETFTLRDKRGFPNWQGGRQRRSARRFGGD